MNGVHQPLHACYAADRHSVRHAVDPAQLRMLAHVGRAYDRGYGHFTTRQNIQFHWIKLKDLPDVMADLARAGLHGMQTSGNCVRNITTDQWAGVAPGEIEDPRISAELLRQHSTLHPEFSFLPRKFKIALTASAHDRAAVRVHDIGLHMHRNDAGEIGNESIVGRQSPGAHRSSARPSSNSCPNSTSPAMSEAILQVYNPSSGSATASTGLHQIQVHELGAEAFAKEVEVEWQTIKDGALALDPALIAEVAARFRYPDCETLEDSPPQLAQARAADPRFSQWLDNSVSNHKLPGYSIVTLSLKPEGGTPGDATSEQMDTIADLADHYSFGEVRVGHEQGACGNAASPAARSAGAVASARAALPPRMSGWSPTSFLARASTTSPLVPTRSIPVAQSRPVTAVISLIIAPRSWAPAYPHLGLHPNACGHCITWATSASSVSRRTARNISR